VEKQKELFAVVREIGYPLETILSTAESPELAAGFDRPVAPVALHRFANREKSPRFAAKERSINVRVCNQ
jgi:hypothetical protein